MDPVEGDPLNRAILLVGYSFSLIYIFLKPGAVARAFGKSPLLWLLVLWAIMSIAWSDYPEVTFRKVSAVILTTLYALALFIRYKFPELLKILAFSFWIALVSSLVLAVLLPEWGIMGYPHEGAWRGIFVHKNVLGRIAALSLIVFGTRYFMSSSHRSKFFWLSGFALGVIMLLESRSVTSLVLGLTTLLTSVLLYLGCRWKRVFPVMVFLIIIVSGVSISWFEQNSEFIFDLMGKDNSLTGRIPLWNVLMTFVEKRLWLGYGYGAFWLGAEGPSGTVLTRVGWLPPHAHNGFLDLWVDLGVIGLVLGSALVFTSMLSAINLTLARKSTYFFWSLISTFVFIYNLAESSFLRTNHLFWVLFVWLSLYVSSPAERIMEVREEKRKWQWNLKAN